MGCCHEKNPDYRKELVRLKKIAGQIEGISKMIEDRRYCPDIINQINAVVAALRSLNGVLLKSHMQNCVYDAFLAKNDQEMESKIKELIDIYTKNIS